MADFTLFETADYYHRLHAAITKAKHTINITSFDLIYDYKTKDLLDAVVVAAKRGVAVTVSADVFTFNEIRKKILGPISVSHPSGSVERSYVTRLREAGGIFVWLGETRALNPYKQRNHEKWSIIDDDVFCFGGINLYDAGLKNNDFMLHAKDPALAAYLRQEHTRIIHAPQEYIGSSYEIDSASICYIDSAEPYDSVIYREACLLAQNAISATYVSQYYPTGKLGSYLKKINTTYYMNRPRHMRRLAKLMLTFDSIRCNIPNNYHKKKYLHAKFIIFTMPNGEKVAMTGSHNFSYAGVRFGTIEVAMNTTNPRVISQLENFVNTIS